MNKVAIIVALGLVALLANVEARTKWFDLEAKHYSFADYVKEHNKVYESDSEMNFRREIFEARLNGIKEHNASPYHTYKKGVNKFTDRTQEELENMLGYKKSIAYTAKANRDEPVFDETKFDLKSLPTSVDWRDAGALTAVKDQGDCGSCWTFATAEMIESMWFLATGQLMDLSEQQILDCTPNPNQCGGTGGCGGGTTELAYAQIINLGGLTTEWQYPYISYSGNNFNCHINQTKPLAKINDFINLPTNHYAPVLYSVATVGPMAVSVDASLWFEYETGVFNGCNQTNPDLDHAVQLVGYGTDATYGDYWTIRNSWATNWGEDGFIRIHRSETVECGVDVTPHDGDECNGGPKTVVVCGTCGVLYDVNYPITLN